MMATQISRLHYHGSLASRRAMRRQAMVSSCCALLVLKMAVSHHSQGNSLEHTPDPVQPFIHHSIIC